MDASEFRLGRTVIARSEVRHNRSGGASTIRNLSLALEARVPALATRREWRVIVRT
jgi:hypothetical protein